jgi:outer membrane protein assembly factor BamB
MDNAPLRLRPGIALVILQWLLAFALPAIAPDAEIAEVSVGLIGMIGGIVCGLGVVIWWLAFSRARWFERVGALALIVIALLVTRLLVDPSIKGAGMGILLFIGAVPGWSLALVVGAAVASRLSGARRMVALTVAIVLSCVPWLMLRTAGLAANGSEYHWRWTPTPEEVLLARGDDVPPVVAPVSPAVVSPIVTDPAVVNSPEAEPLSEPGRGRALSEPGRDRAMSELGRGRAMSEPEGRVEWPGFRGALRDGVIRGLRINTDWTATPPVELWRRPIGPGWSSFSVQGDLIYTQEQRGDDELVSCYRLSTGEPVWGHRDAVRFWESNGGAGPRATPTIHDGRVYAFGATGILNALDARTGALLWSRQVTTDTKRTVPIWGFASSPLVVDDVVIVAAAGTLAGYDRMTGAHQWTGPSYGGSYSSPHRFTFDGVEQVVLLGGPGAISVAPRDGTVLWTHEWEPGPMVQPALTADGDILINAIASAGGMATRRLGVARTGGVWTLAERWTSIGLKPYFNDLVVHKGHAYGFDGSILSAIDLTDGARKWKGGRYGNGQLVLLAEQDLLLVISEEGELALVSATPDKFTELTRFPALDGKTWNHPVVVGDTLLVRNGAEMVAFRLPR